MELQHGVQHVIKTGYTENTIRTKVFKLSEYVVFVTSLRLRTLNGFWPKVGGLHSHRKKNKMYPLILRTVLNYSETHTAANKTCSTYCFETSRFFSHPPNWRRSTLYFYVNCVQFGTKMFVLLTLLNPLILKPVLCLLYAHINRRDKKQQNSSKYKRGQEENIFQVRTSLIQSVVFYHSHGEMFAFLADNM